MAKTADTKSAPPTVLDSSALLALFNDEPGAAMVERALQGACVVSAVNHTEVLTKLLDKGLSASDAASVMLSVAVQVVAYDNAQSVDAAWLRSATRSVGLSLGDRACLALARSLGAPVLTADKPWLGIAQAVSVQVQCIR
jgi:ribonuclease VapC